MRNIGIRSPGIRAPASGAGAARFILIGILPRFFPLNEIVAKATNLVDAAI
jgi:hypothetical protein